MNTNSPTPSKQMNLKLPLDLRAELEAFAKAEDRSISGTIRQALREYLAKRGQTQAE